MAGRDQDSTKLKIRKGDTVEVITGKDAAAAARCSRCSRGGPPDRRGLNIVKRHTKPRPVKGTRGAQMTPGGVIENEAPMRVPTSRWSARAATSRRASATASRDDGTRCATAAAGLRQGHRGD